MNRSLSEWQMYERMIAQMFADQLSTNYRVTPTL